MLDAGAVLPPGSTAREDADTLTVRTYTHAALGARSVVRLVPGTLGEAEDLALDFLGLVRETRTPEVGQIRREALGFPAWALVNDPANGHHALALVKDVERLARLAKSRPGTAKEGFEELGERLGRAVPHFLPTFYEQAARVFLQYDNTTYAAAFFGKARDAERVHALTVDEDRQRAVFLEFAFAGALTVKALKQHVKDLAGRLDATKAWDQFRQLTVERCAAGMPPYASLPQDARVLIKAAGLSRVDAECDLVADLVASPAAVRAPASFWTAYRAILPVLAEQRPAVRARMLEIMPAGLDRGSESDEFWLALLAECGADRLLTGENHGADGADGVVGPDGPGETMDGVDAADWLSRWAAHRKHGAAVCDASPATLDLVARMAPRLRAGGRAVDLFAGRRHTGADISLLDLCAAQDIPLALPDASTEVHLGLDRWVRDTRPERRDLAAVAADPRLRPLLLRAVGAVGRDRQAAGILEHLSEHHVLGDVLREWLDGAVDELAGAVGLPGAREALHRLGPFRSVAPRVNPAAVARAAAYETGPLLGRTLRAGIFDELGWPALDEAVCLLDAGTRKDRDNTLVVNEAWPCLILSRRGKAVVVGPDEVLLEHDLRLPADLDRWQRPQFRYTDGELLVAWWHEGKQRGYWSTRPSEVVTLTGEQIAHRWHYDNAGAPSIPLQGGGRATGGRALHAGDTVLPASRAVIADGTMHWRQGRQGRQHVWLEYDPTTGAHGRASLPALLRSGIRDDATLLQEWCEVLPVQPGLEQSPFGTDGAVLGRWVRAEDESGEIRTTAGTPDGRTVTLRSPRHGERTVPLGALRLPGGAEPVVARAQRRIALFSGDDGGDSGVLGRVTPNERGGEFAAGTRLIPPLAFWHALRPRDERASAVLRALTDERAAEVLRAAAQALAERRARVAAAGGADGAASGPDTGAGAAGGRGPGTGGSAPGATVRSGTAGGATGGPGGTTAGPGGVIGGPGGVTGGPGGMAADGESAVPSAEEVVRQAVCRSLPGLTDERLLSGVAALVRTTLQIADTVTRFVTPPVEQPKPDRNRTEGMFADYRPEHGDDHTLRTATDGLARMWGSWGGTSQWTALRQIRAVNHVLSGKPAEGKQLPDRARLTALGDGWHSDEHTVPGIGMVWPSLLAVLRPLAYRATAPTTAEDQREALLLLFEALTEGPLAAPGSTLREIVLSEPHDKQQRAGQVLRRDGRTVVVLGCQRIDYAHDRVNWLAVDHDPTGAFGAVARFALEKETRYTSAFPPDQLAAVARLIRDKGPAPWQPGAPGALAAATCTGLGPLQATVLLAGQPRRLDTDALAVIGLKPRRLDVGNGMLNSLLATDRESLIGALLPDEPAELWTAGPDTDAAGRVWAERLGSLVRVPEDLAPALDGLPAGSADDVLNPPRTAWLSRTTVQRLDKDGRLVAEDPAAVPGRHMLTSAVAALTSLAYALPYGHPLRAALPEGLAALRHRIADPALLLHLDVESTEKGETTATELRKAYGLPATGGADADGMIRVGEALVLHPWYGDKETVLVRPAGLTGPDDAVFGLLEGLVGATNGAGLRAVREVLGDALARTLAAGRDPEGSAGYAQNPAVSVPALVTEVAETYGLGEDAATLYLQLLALPDPTDRNCARWTGWKPARLKKARAELAATDLVVEAKRPRAGRSLFLPCGWRDLKTPALPLETWKESLYPVRESVRAVPLLPVPELFARAWDRGRAGDAPAYEELTTRVTRRGRRG
ncbi:hypothetical protein RM812_11665 [Streptomyces sp. DSM 40712]|uniref:DNA-binding protein n=1 Tax=Streptomyces lancefieldiae TaxID=3075520 RepID=A0ABU3AL15_9ACTN|nr:hypothetical protein [Streptomyces sp. DSM 40712]MDT0610883.1 hypothetical protein [Streptomyces sp. DSM 40712]